MLLIYPSLPSAWPVASAMRSPRLHPWVFFVHDSCRSVRKRQRRTLVRAIHVHFAWQGNIFALTWRLCQRTKRGPSGMAFLRLGHLVEDRRVALWCSSLLRVASAVFKVDAAHIRVARCGFQVLVLIWCQWCLLYAVGVL